MMVMMQTFPLDPGGAASDRSALVGERDGLHITDCTAWPRFGIKGPGSADWLTSVGIDLPNPNRLAVRQGLVVMRLGRNDIVFLSDDGSPNAVAALRDQWQNADGSKGYLSWREEGWAWLHLDGPALDSTLAQCCAVDLQPSAHEANRIAQTSFAHADAVVTRRNGSADVFFDISATAVVLSGIRQSGAGT